MQKDGLNDAFDDAAMGTFAELCADEHSFSREDQVTTHFDDFDDFYYQVLSHSIASLSLPRLSSERHGVEGGRGGERSQCSMVVM